MASEYALIQKRKDDRIARHIEQGLNVRKIQIACRCDWRRIRRICQERGLTIRGETPVEYTLSHEGRNWVGEAANLRWGSAWANGG